MCCFSGLPPQRTGPRDQVKRGQVVAAATVRGQAEVQPTSSLSFLFYCVVTLCSSMSSTQGKL